jgi:hypothetical protein
MYLRASGFSSLAETSKRYNKQNLRVAKCAATQQQQKELRAFNTLERVQQINDGSRSNSSMDVLGTDVHYRLVQMDMCVCVVTTTNVAFWF